MELRRKNKTHKTMTRTTETSYRQALEKWLGEYLGVLEEAIDKDIDFLDSDNYDTYKEAVRTFNAISDKPYKPTYYLGLIEDQENELPFEKGNEIANGIINFLGL